MHATGHSATDDPRVTSAVEEYLAALERGERPQRQQFLAGHAAVAGPLGECLDALDFLYTATGGLRLDGAPEPDAPDTNALAAAGVLGEYRIVREIGRGGMGVVHEAEQVSLGRRVALKVLPFAAVLDPRQLQRFKNEALAAAQLDHPNIVDVYAVGCERGVHYYAMRHIEGHTLAEMIRELRWRSGLKVRDAALLTTRAEDREGRIEDGGEEGSRGQTSEISSRDSSSRLSGVGTRRPDNSQPSILSPEPCAPLATHDSPATTSPLAALSTEHATNAPAYFRRVAEIGIPIAEALDYAHQHGIVHRDVKPSNLMLDAAGRAWVTDFGLAHIEAEASLTMTGDVLGTLRYMSPEQATGDRRLIDHRTDVYSLGVTLYELLTLRPAFPESDRARLVQQIATQDPVPPRRLNRAVPVELETIVLKALSKTPAERYATAQEMVEDLRRFLEDKPIQAKRPNMPQRLAKWSRRHKALVWSAVTMLLMALAALSVSTAMILRERSEVVRQRDLAREALSRERDALRQAQEQRAKAEAERQRAVANLKQAQNVVNQYFTLTSESTLLNEPGLQPLRKRLLQEAIPYYEEFARSGSDDPQIQVEQAVTHLRLGQVYFHLKRLDACIAALERGFKLVEKLLEQHPDDAETFLPLAGFWHGARDWLEGDWQPVKDPVHASTVLSKGIGLWEHFAKTHPSVAGFQADLSKFYDYLEDFQRARGERQEAYESLKRVREIRENLARQHPQEAEYQAELRWAYHSLAILLEGDDPDQAEHFHALAVAALESEPYWHRWGVAFRRAQFGRFLRSRRRPDEAVEQFRQAIALLEGLAAEYPYARGFQQELSRHRLEFALLLQEAGRTDEAQTILGQVVPATAKEYADRGWFYQQTKAYDRALADYRKAVELEPDNAEHHLSLLFFYADSPDVRLQNHRLAVEHGQTAVALELNNPKYRACLAYAFRVQGNRRAARDECARALELDPNHPIANEQMAVLCLDAGDLDNALAHVQTGIDSAPHDWAHHKTRGDVYAKLGRYEDALADYNKALELEPGNSITHKRRAAAYYHLKQFDKALADIAKAIELNPHDTSAVTWLLPHLSNAPPGFREELFKLSDQLIEELPEYGSAYHARGRLYAHFGETDKALADFTKQIDLGPENATLLNNTAWLVVCYPGWEPQTVAQALTWSQRAVELAPEAAHAWNTLGVGYFRAANWEEAIVTLAKSEELASDQHLAFNAFFLAMAHWQLGHKDEARQWYDNAVEWMEANRPNDEELLRFRAEAEELLGVEPHAKTPSRKE